MAIYDEAKPYIFISYSHRDSEKVIGIMNFLRAEGFNLWYDDGIDPGTEWDENIANHIINCSYFIAFVSNGYINSKNCRDELNFSRDQDKEQLLIYLEDVTLPNGMAMRMNRLQAIYWHRYKKDIREAYGKLLLAKGIEKCRIVETTFPSKSSVKPVSKQDMTPKSNNLLLPGILLVLGIVIIGLLIVLLLQNKGEKERIPNPVASYKDEEELGALSTRQLLEKAKDYTDAGDYDKALPYFEKAASRYDGEALRWLGIIYQVGHSSEGVNEEKAIAYYEKAIDRGDYESLRLLGTLYEEQGNEGDAEYYFRLYKEVNENAN